MGKAISVNISSILCDVRDEGTFIPERLFDFSDLVVGNRISVSYYQDDIRGELVVTKWESEDAVMLVVQQSIGLRT